MSDISDITEIAKPTPEKPAEGTTPVHGEEPTDELLEGPSTEKEPGEEPRAEGTDTPDAPSAPATSADDEPSHRAVGIGVIDGE